MSRLLFISPVTPALTGNGRAMRAGRMLTALATRFDIHLLILESQLETPPDFSALSGLCKAIRFLAREDGAAPIQKFRRAVLRRAPAVFSLLFQRPPEWAPITAHRLALAAQAFPGVRFDAVHVFRLCLAPYARPWLSADTRPASVVLDLDDIESVTRVRIARLYRLNRRPLRGLISLHEAALLRQLECRWLPRFDGVWVCSRLDADRLAPRVPGVRLRVAPNVVPIPSVAPEVPVADPFRFLFVGTLGYYPNQDALLWFIREILPRLRQQTDCPFLVTVAGGGLPPAIARQLHSEPEVEFRGYVEEVSSLYRESGAVVVPLRAGGGSRIKIIEAFANGVPVISTSSGAEGLEVRPDVHLLLGDDPGRFAAQCVRLMCDPACRAALAREAFALAASSYSPAALDRSLGVT